MRKRSPVTTGPRTCAVIAAALAAPVSSLASTVTLNVQASANPWLAAAPEGATDGWGDTAPADAPPLVSGLSLVGGSAVYVSATGQGAVGPIQPGVAFQGPDGQASRINTHAAANGIAGASGPFPGLAAVFLTDAAPDVATTPAGLNFSQPGDRAFLTLSMLSRQVFFTGDGINHVNGDRQRFVVPTDATRLYFGVFDQGSHNNLGSFDVSVSNAMQWTNAAGGDFGVRGHWDFNLTPSSIDNLEHNLPETYTVDFTTNQQAFSVSVNAGNVTYALATRTLTVTDKVNVTSTSPAAPASLTIAGGTIAASSLNVGDNGIVDLVSTARVQANTNISSGGTLTGGGAITGNVANAGEISPGNNGAGFITITGAYNQTTAGTLRMQLAGLTPDTQYDRLLTSGAATLGGTLAVTKVPGFEPDRGDSFDLLDAGGFNGHFNAVNLPTLAGEFDRWDTSKLATEGIISVRSKSTVDLHSSNALLPPESEDRGVINVLGANGGYVSEIVDLAGDGFARGRVNIHGFPTPTTDKPLYALLDLRGDVEAIEDAINNLEHTAGLPPFVVLRDGDQTFEQLAGLYDRPISTWDIALLFEDFAAPVDGNAMWFSWDFDPTIGVTLDQLVIVPEPMSGVVLLIAAPLLLRRRRRGAEEPRHRRG